MDQLLSIIDAFLRLAGVGQTPLEFLALAGLAFTRLISFLLIVPFFGGAAVPGRVKIAVAAAFVIVAYPALTISPTHGSAWLFGTFGFIALLVKEALVGFSLGFLAALIFEAIPMAGRLIDLQRGGAFAELFAPQLQSEVSELGQFKLQLAIVLFLLMGAHRLFIGAMIESFTIIPATGFPKLASGWSPLTEFVVLLGGRMITIAVQLAAPAMFALLLTDFFFGLINRVAPQINVFFLSLQVKAVVGVMVILLALQQYQEQYLRFFAESWRAFEALLQMFR